jgi:hypothetical protein
VVAFPKWLTPIAISRFRVILFYTTGTGSNSEVEHRFRFNNGTYTFVWGMLNDIRQDPSAPRQKN